MQNVRLLLCFVSTLIGVYVQFFCPFPAQRAKILIGAVSFFVLSGAILLFDWVLNPFGFVGVKSKRYGWFQLDSYTPRQQGMWWVVCRRGEKALSQCMPFAEVYDEDGFLIHEVAFKFVTELVDRFERGEVNDKKEEQQLRDSRAWRILS